MSKHTWTKADYKKAKILYTRSRVMSKIVEQILASSLSYKEIAAKAGVAHSTICNWASGTTTNGRIDTISLVLSALNLEMVLKPIHHNKEKKPQTTQPSMRA